LICFVIWGISIFKLMGEAWVCKEEIMDVKNIDVGLDM
jgi:hypothetical protein